MKVAVIGWGSLIWNPGTMNLVFEKWRNDGPKLPIEFARKSKDGRITLVIYKPYMCEPKRWVRTYWNIISAESIGEAIEDLGKREHTSSKHIAHITTDSDNIINDTIKIEIENWIQDKKLDGAVWTNLPSTTKSLKEVILYLKSLQGDTLRRVKEYIEKTPRQIVTPWRREIEREFGWRCKSEI